MLSANQVVLDLMSKAHGKNDMKFVAKLVVEVATKVVEEKVPPCFSELARLLDIARSNQCFDVVASSVLIHSRGMN